MNTNIRLAQLEDEASLDLRVEEVFDTNAEYLQLSIKSFFEKYNPLLKEESKFVAYEKLKELCRDPNFRLMHSLYGFYFDDEGNEKKYSSDLNKHFDIKDFRKLEKTFCADIGGMNPEGIISTDGVFYPAVKSHYLLCSWMNLKGVDIRGCVRTTYGSNTRILFSDLTDYVYMDKETDFALTEQQVKAMKTLYRLNTKDSQFAPFHNVVEESYRLGFCRFASSEKTRRQIELFEDVLGKRQVDSGEILSTKIKYY